MANIRTAKNRGAFDFVPKPVDFLDLETTIAKTLELLQEARQRQAAPSQAGGAEDMNRRGLEAHAAATWMMAAAAFTFIALVVLKVW